MAFFKCKMCGGTIEFEPGASVGVCDSCGTRQTLPRLDDDRRAKLFDRANHFRRNNEYDKAEAIFEQILNEDDTDAEAYWSLLLCRYGIVYVEDPATHKRVPTVNRTQHVSIFADEDYKEALAHADGYQRVIYEEEANAIDKIQKGILAVSRKEKPFDVFISYKDSDEAGNRTRDSVLAQDLYARLSESGFRVFFSRITLEDKVGEAYEPYIYAALHSAKVMVVVGTRPEHFNAVWVKNEWSRYLALIAAGEEKTLIPAYRGMDPYDLPVEFSHLQAQDMGRLGFMQDLLAVIRRLLKKEETPEAEMHPAGPAQDAVPRQNRGPLINLSVWMDKAWQRLQRGEWEDAQKFARNVLNFEADNAQALLVILLARYRVSSLKELGQTKDSFAEDQDYYEILRHADHELQKELTEVLAALGQRRLAGAKCNADVLRVRQLAGKLDAWDSEAAAKLKEACERTEQKLLDDRYNSIYNDVVHHRYKGPKGEAVDPALQKALAELGSYRDAEKLRIYLQAATGPKSYQGYLKAAELFDGLSSFADAKLQAEQSRLRAKKLLRKIPGETINEAVTGVLGVFLVLWWLVLIAAGVLVFGFHWTIPQLLIRTLLAVVVFIVLYSVILIPVRYFKSKRSDVKHG